MNLRPLLLRSALGSRRPITSGSLWLRGVRERLVIRRDSFGIPHIEAQNDDDAWFGLGFCQGQDRAFQLELRLRTVRGSLSALVGRQTLAIDRLSRRVGLHASSKRQLPVLDDDVRCQIDAFARGINAGYASGLRAWPHEFTLLRSQPTPWQAADVAGNGKLMSFLLVGNWDVELARLKILLTDGPEALRDLDPSYPAEQPVSSPPNAAAGEAVDRLSEDIAALTAFLGRSGGSNNWALGGSRTASGRPLLANDPHLDPALPPHWYLAHLRTPEWQVAGAALIGSPAIGSGHNGFAAWGITAGLTDTVDLFVEEVGADGHSVRRGGGYESCETRRELIEVKGGDAVIEDVLETPRGPIVTPALEGGLPALSMRAVWLDARPARGFLQVHRARSFDDFRREFEQWPLLAQNVAYADVEGNIAWQLVGEVPRRRKGNGALPLAAADPETGWFDETVAFEEMPYELNPATDYVASANNKPVRDGDGPYLGADWLDGYRAGRILETLAQREDWDLESTQRLQLDETSLAWRQVRDVVLATPVRDEDAAVGIGLLRDWDGVVAASSAAATVYELFLAEMWRRAAEARAPNAWRWAMGQGFTDLLPLTTFALGRSSALLHRIEEQPSGWFQRGWQDEMADALSAVVRRLRRQHGAPAEGWAWGSLRTLTLQHPLGRIAALAPVFNRGPFAWGGDGSTVSQAGVAPLHPTGNPLAVASLRAVIDVGDWDAARFSLPGGQSGSPFSPHYDDLLAYWLRGAGVPIAWSAEAVSAATRETLTLRPLATESRAS